MSQASGIEWTDATWNPVRGCSMAAGSEAGGCLNCYAARQAARGLPGHLSPTTGKPFAVMRGAGPRWTGDVELIPHLLDWPLRWRGAPVAKAERRPSRIFVNSMSDLFHEALPDAAIDRVFAVMALAWGHTFQVLTKRPGRMLAYLRQVEAERDMQRWINAALEMEIAGSPCVAAVIEDCAWPLPNVWLGVSAEDQAAADARIPLLLRCPAAVRFVSYEPALGPVLFDNGESSWLTCRNGAATRLANDGHCCGSYDAVGECFRGLDWVIVGGESGPGARPFDLAWARQAVRQCREAGVPCFVKQLGAWIKRGPEAEFRTINSLVAALDKNPRTEWHAFKLCHRKGGNWDEWPEDLRVREFPA